MIYYANMVTFVTYFSRPMFPIFMLSDRLEIPAPSVPSHTLFL